jgi:methionyl-tRNA synthetase
MPGLLDTCAWRTRILPELYEQREFGKVLREIMLLADRVNAYVDANKPWELAKQEGMDAGACKRCARCASRRSAC